jgi:hypothetical protein
MRLVNRSIKQQIFLLAGRILKNELTEGGFVYKVAKKFWS